MFNRDAVHGLPIAPQQKPVLDVQMQRTIHGWIMPEVALGTRDLPRTQGVRQFKPQLLYHPAKSRHSLVVHQQIDVTYPRSPAVCTPVALPLTVCDTALLQTLRQYLQQASDCGLGLSG
jgi:hypothetical protein